MIRKIPWSIAGAERTTCQTFGSSAPACSPQAQLQTQLLLSALWHCGRRLPLTGRCNQTDTRLDPWTYQKGVFMGLLRVKGSIDLNQFWPTGKSPNILSDADTVHVEVDPATSFTFEGNVTHAFDFAW